MMKPEAKTATQPFSSWAKYSGDGSCHGWVLIENWREWQNRRKTKNSPETKVDNSKDGHPD
jgi:hypothetical protein